MRSAFAALCLGVSACSGGAPQTAPDAEMLYRRALDHVSKGETDAALRLLDRAAAADPARGDIVVARARLRREGGRVEEALADYADAVERYRNRPADRAATLLARASLLGELRRTEAAEADLAAALALFPEYVEALLQRSRLRRDAGRNAEADEDLARARKVGAAMADRFYNDGVRELNFRRAGEAERLFAFTAELDPAHVRAHVALGRVYFELRRFDEAAGALGRAVELRPRDAELLLHRGNAYLALARDEKAFADYSRAVEIDPKLAAAWAARGIVLRRHFRDAARAEADFGRALAIDPRNYLAVLNRGLLHHEQKRLDPAETDLRTALGIYASAEGAQSLGRVLHDRGEFGKAVDAFEKALTICRDDGLRGAIEKDLARAREALKEKPK